MRMTLIGGLVAAFGLAVSGAHAELTILQANGSRVPDGTSEMTFNPDTGGWTITLSSLYNPGLETVYNIHGNAGEVIDQVIIDVPCWEGPNGECVPAGSPVIVRVLSDAPGGITSIGAILQTGDAETILADVQCTQDLGPVIAENIGVIDVGRDVIGPIVATTEDNAARGITNLIAGRDILGDVLAENGRITMILAVYGTIGQPGAPVRIEAKHNILRISAESIYADIDAHVNGGAGGIFMLNAADFAGTVRMRKIIGNPHNGNKGRFSFTNSWEGLIVMDFPFQHTDYWVEFPSTGFNGQFIANATQQWDPLWLMPIYLGPPENPDLTLLSETYSHTVDMLGGGSVGMAPFHLHAPSCSPPSGSEIDVSSGDPVEILLRHYGPVTWEGGSPITISRRATGTGDPYQPIPGQVQIDPAVGDSNSMLVRGLGDAEPFEPGFDYRIQSTAALVCDQVLGSPPVVPWEYHVTVIGDAPPHTCVGDLDADGFVNASDLAAALGAWGACPGCAADVDGNGVVNAGDLAMILGNWGPCTKGTE